MTLAINIGSKCYRIHYAGYRAVPASSLRKSGKEYRETLVNGRLDKLVALRASLGVATGTLSKAS